MRSKKEIKNQLIRKRIHELRRVLRLTEKRIAIFYDSPEYRQAKTAEEIRDAENKFDLPTVDGIRSDMNIRINLLTGSDLMYSENPADILSFLEYRRDNAIENLNGEFPDQLSEKYRNEIRHHFEIERMEAAEMISRIKGESGNA